MESSSRGKRERGMKAVTVKLPRKKVNCRHSVFEYSDTRYPSILNDNKKSAFIWPRELRITADPVIIFILLPFVAPKVISFFFHLLL